MPPAIPKPRRGGRRREKARAKRQESKVVAAVRQACVTRDGYCRFGPLQPDRLYRLVGSCDGPSEWAHMEEKRRSKTRGLPPEERHTVADSLMMCKRHHDAYDTHKFGIEALTSAGAEGLLRVKAGADSYEETR
jgi:hypothetical protein